MQNMLISDSLGHAPTGNKTLRLHCKCESNLSICMHGIIIDCGVILLASSVAIS